MFEYKPTKEVEAALEDYNTKIKFLEEAEKIVAATDSLVIEVAKSNEAAVNHMEEVKTDTEKAFTKYDAIFHRDLVDQLLKHIEKLEQSNQYLQLVIKENQELVTYQMSNRLGTESENVRLAQSNDALRAENIAFKAEIKRLKIVNDSQNYLLKDFQARIDILEEKAFYCNKEIEKRDAKIRNLEEDKKNLCVENSVLRSRVNLYLEDTVRLEKVVDECTSRNNELEKMYLQMMEERNSLLRANAVLQGENKEMADRLAKNEETIKSLSLIKNSIF